MKASLLFLAIAAALGGCMKSMGTIGQADSQSVGNALGSGIESSAQTFGPMNTQPAADGCVTLSGDVSDPDQDNIPTDATLTFDCTTTSVGVTETLTGTMNVKDDQPNAVAWAFTGSQMLTGVITDTRGDTITVDTNGQLTATQAGATGPFGLSRSASVTTTLVGAGGASVAVDETADWTLTFAPQVSWTPGQVIVTGQLGAQGSWEVTVGDNSASATIATPTPLTVDPSCSTRVTGGAVDATWTGGGKDHTLTVTWTGCGASTVGYSER